jgi:hypothetical protein
MVLRNLGRVAAIALLASGLTACQAAKVAINNQDLQIKTHMSESIFLDPVPEHLKTVYISARNTSDHPEIDLRSSLTQAIQARGYRVVTDPNKAHYMIRSNVLQAGKIEEKDKEQMLMGSYGEPLLAGVGSAVLANSLGGNNAAMAGVGLGMAAATFLANELVKDVTYALTVDIQLSERPLKGGKVRQVTSNSKDGGVRAGENLGTMGGSSNSYSTTSNSTQQFIAEDKDFKQYNVRAMAYADQMNLKFEDAAVPLTNKLTSSISNLLD